MSTRDDIGGPSVVPLTSVGSLDTEEGARFLQGRLRLWAKVVGIVSGVFWIRDAVIMSLERSVQDCLVQPTFVVHGIAVALTWTIHILARQRWTRRTRLLRVLDIGGLLVQLLLYTALAWMVSLVYPRAGNLLGVLITGIMLTTRAVIIPEPPRRAAIINAVACLPLMGMATAQIPSLGAEAVGPAEALISTGMWAAAFVLIATVSQRVIYGLRTRVREARQLGQYTLEEKLGEGGMGRVFRARHAMLRRPTAVKLLPPEKVDVRHLERFEREVQLTAELTHPNTISIYDYGRTPDGIFYYAMEFLDGVNLEDLIKEHGPLPAERVVHVLRQVCGALAEAHDVGLIHRDVKPANVFLTQRGGEYDVVKVIDFGLVKDLHSADSSNTADGDDVLTGTPLYMAPEAIKSRDGVDERTDIYAVGAVGYFLLTGEPVFGGETVVEVCAAHLHEPPIPPGDRVPGGVPKDLQAVVLACLAKDPDERPADARRLRRDLDACADAGAWGTDQAQRWWEGRAPRRARHVDFGGSKTIDIDVGERMNAAE